MKSVISVRGENLLLGLTDGTDHTDYFVADCNLLLHQCLARLTSVDSVLSVRGENYLKFACDLLSKRVMAFTFMERK